MALNYIHSGMTFVPITQLGRRPSPVHLAICDTLRPLLTVCDRPEQFPIIPGDLALNSLQDLLSLSILPAPMKHFAQTSMLAPLAPCGRIEKEHQFQSTAEFSSVQPYRSLNVQRLKLSGTGKWPMADYLEDTLSLPFLEPAILRHPLMSFSDGPDFKKEKKEENLALARVWDSRGLLALFDHQHPSQLACRVFNARKNESADRQIGDRRWFNSTERHLQGPSKFLPVGRSIASIHCPEGKRLIGFASDRKNFYHQSLVTRERADTNILPFSFEVEQFRGSAALQELVLEVSRPRSRERDGDRYGMRPRSILCEKDIKTVWAGFRSLFQGDHLGVEFVLSSHANLLRSNGLLDPCTTILRHHVFPRGQLWQGLVIDDYFAVSCEEGGKKSEESVAVQCLDLAEETYKASGVFGPPEKTERDTEAFSDHKARAAGVVTVAAPCSKRVPMIALSLKAAALPFLSRALASGIAGNWISIFMYRRTCSCVLSEIFSLGPRFSQDAGEVFPLTRATGDELVLASVLGLTAVTDISVPYSKQIFATGASNNKGAVTSKRVDEAVAEIAWLGGDRKGAYTLLDNSARQQLRALGVDVDDQPIAEDFQGPPKALGFYFDCVEICGGSGVLSEAMTHQGLIVCPPIDLSSSRHYDLTNVKLVEWIFQMLHEKRFKSIVCEPVCTTFSPAQHPASRSYSQPLGFDRAEPKTLLGNTLASRCLAIKWFAWRCYALALLEQPQLSKMAWLSFWRFLLQIGFAEAIINSCAYGSIHKKPFRLLAWGLDIESMNIPCPGGHEHVRIEGKYTKPSAVYHPELAKFIAEKFKQALQSSKHESDICEVAIESVVLNDILQQGDWEVEAEWT